MACSHHAKKKNASDKYIFSLSSDNTSARLRYRENPTRREGPKNLAHRPKGIRMMIYFLASMTFTIGPLPAWSMCPFAAQVDADFWRLEQRERTLFGSRHRR